MAYFPAVGLLLGISAAALHFLLSLALPVMVCNFIVIVFMVVFTGNMHGDGLMDTADGIFSGQPRERVLEIMRDSRVGSHGVMAGTLALLAKLVLLAEMPREALWPALVLMPSWGRWAQVYSAAVYPYARTGGGTGGFTEFVGIREVLWSSLTVLAAGALLLQLKSGILAIAVFIGTALFGRYIFRKIGGITGDTLGAVNELAEVLSLVVLLIILKF